MKLYYSPGACSLSPHIALLEAGLPFTLDKTDLKAKKTEKGVDYFTINSKGSVPALQLDDGQVLTEGPAIVQYIADQKPDSGLAPRAGTLERYRLIEMLNFITSEVHKSFSPLFDPTSSADWKQAAKTSLGKKFDWLSKKLDGRQFLVGDSFTVADAYLYTVLNWTRHVGFDLKSSWPVLADYHTRIGHRPKIQEALKAEGLIK